MPVTEVKAVERSQCREKLESCAWDLLSLRCQWGMSGRAEGTSWWCDAESQQCREAGRFRTEHWRTQPLEKDKEEKPRGLLMLEDKSRVSLEQKGSSDNIWCYWVVQKRKAKEKQLLDLTACRLVVILAKTQLMEQWEQSGGWSGLWSERERRSDEHSCGSSLEKCGDGK